MLFVRSSHLGSSSSGSTPTSPSSPPTANLTSTNSSGTTNLTSLFRMASQAKVTCHGAGLVSADADFKNSFTVFVQQGKIGGISVAFEGEYLNSLMGRGLTLMPRLFKSRLDYQRAIGN